MSRELESDPFELTCVKKKKPGNDLLSQPLARLVPSAREGLTAVFGMGTGVSPPPSVTWNLYNLFLTNEQSVYHTSIRPISTTRLNALLRLHLWPINLLVSEGPNMETSS